MNSIRQREVGHVVRESALSLSAVDELLRHDVPALALARVREAQQRLAHATAILEAEVRAGGWL